MRKVTGIIVITLSLVAIGRAQTSESISKPKDYTAHVVGYAHMDMAWLWRWEESIHDIMYNTFTNQIRLMDQNPDYTFAQDQAVVLDSMEHFYPDVFKGLQEKARTGNFIPATSGWVQMDENVSRRRIAGAAVSLRPEIQQGKIWPLHSLRLAAGRLRPPRHDAADCAQSRN